MYHLKGVVIHEGQGIQFGHYYALVKSQGRWLKFDDTRVSVLGDKDHQIYFGGPSNSKNQSGWPCAYMLLYESEEMLRDYFSEEMAETHSVPS